MADQNVLNAIRDMRNNLKALGNCSIKREREIYRDAVACGDLMNYSHMVANTNSSEWKTLDGLVAAVMIKVSDEVKDMEL